MQGGERLSGSKRERPGLGDLRLGRGGLAKLHLGPRGPGDLSGSRVYGRSAQVGGVPPPALRLDRPARLQSVLRLTADWDRAEQRGKQEVRDPRRPPRRASDRTWGLVAERSGRPWGLLAAAGCAVASCSRKSSAS